MTTELHRIAIRAEYHRKILGHKLLVAVEAHLKQTATQILTVKTRAPSAGDRFYARTNHRAGALPMRGSPRRITVAMVAGSLIGAALGGLAVAVAPASLLKVLLGIVLIVAATRTMGHIKA